MAMFFHGLYTQHQGHQLPHKLLFGYNKNLFTSHVLHQCGVTIMVQYLPQPRDEHTATTGLHKIFLVYLS